MKKFLITTVLFMLALTVVANDALYKMVDKYPLNLSVGVELKPEIKINDFSTITAATPSKLGISVSSVEPVDDAFSGCYRYDFAKEPFDGRLEILVWGEPLPMPFTTLLVALGTIGIILMNKNNKWSKQDTTLR